MSTMLQNRLGPRPGPAPVQTGSFVPAEVFQNIGNMSRADADSCDFGVIKLDDAGKVVMVNRYQSDLGGVAIPNFENKHYFTQIAPCTNNSLFWGTFKKGVAANNLNVTFPYTFTFKMKPTNVRVHMFRCQNTRTNWIFVQRA